MRAHWPELRWHPDGGLTLRLDGLDALETHYLALGGLGVLRQPAPWPEQAAESLLRFLGFNAVHRQSSERIVTTSPAATRGAIALRRADRFGRAVAFAFRGQFQLPTHAPLSLTDEVVRSSANWHLLRQGRAYPVFYQDMPPSLMRLCALAANHARKEGLGFWPLDRTHAGWRFTSLEALQRDAVIWPKLFRRLVDFLGGNGGALSLSPFLRWLEMEVGAVTLWEQACQVSFADLVAVEGQCVRLLVAPDAIAFTET